VRVRMHGPRHCSGLIRSVRVEDRGARRFQVMALPRRREPARPMCGRGRAGCGRRRWRGRSARSKPASGMPSTGTIQPTARTRGHTGHDRQPPQPAALVDGQPDDPQPTSPDGRPLPDSVPSTPEFRRNSSKLAMNPGEVICSTCSAAGSAGAGAAGALMPVP